MNREVRQATRSALQRGTATLEFAFVAVTLMVVIFAGLELDRMALVYTTLANAAKVGARYAIVHGSDRSGSGMDGPSGPGGNPPNVVTVVKNFASAGILNSSNLTVTVSYVGSNTTGSQVKVLVSYPYDPFTVLPLGITLSATSQGVITY